MSGLDEDCDTPLAFIHMMRHHERFTKLLQEELGTTPLRSTVRLFSELYSGNADDESKA
ncbi:MULTISPECIES: hypothetical protein [unclassified Paenibacillus]|uniref:hypothetical protein n=1 Tax=unclassified Paenibacillus TaxID=185978 RepID=UPI00020D6BE4|nr:MULTISPECIES: hypothetical protein [unclassified Paenibacillus]EGL17069.1 hypothetical protein HMPREF9413_4793 [Paenibacillus sp. HGF7]